MKNSTILQLSFLALQSLVPSWGAITEVVETNLGGDAAALIGLDFGEDSDSFSDRIHEHNGAAFEGGALDTQGSVIVGLPDYLVGNDYVLFANNARENADYSAVVTTDGPSDFYLLVDNRINGPAGDNSSPNTTDPDLGGTLQWIVDGGWVRVNTGISPDGLPDYTGVDEGGDQVGAGMGLQQFYSIYKTPGPSTSVTVSNNGVGGNNMISLVAAPSLDLDDPISSFSPTKRVVAEGEEVDLKWVINSGATVATIDNEVGDVLPDTDEGSGSIMVTPSTTTTYTLSVESPSGDETAETTIMVRLINGFEGDQSTVNPGGDFKLSWDTRSDAEVMISGVGEVDADAGTVTVNPTESTSYTLTATFGDETETAEVSIFVQPAGQLFALLDIGGTDGQVESGATGEKQIGADVSGTNGLNLEAETLVSATGAEFTIAIDNFDPDGNSIGNLDWRDRGEGTGDPLTLLGEDHVKNNAGMIRVVLGGLPAGEYAILSWHFDACCGGQSEAIMTLVTDANGTAADTGVVGSALETVNADQNTTENMYRHVSQFAVTSNGRDDIIIYFDGQLATDTEVPLNGLEILQTGAGAGLRITDIEVDRAENRVILTWPSSAGLDYSLFASSDLLDFSAELDDSIEGEDGMTTYILTDFDVTAMPKTFFRIAISE